MAKLADKLNACSILYKYGYETTDLKNMMGVSSPKQIITHLRSSKTKPEYKEPQPLEVLTESELQVITDVGFKEYIDEHFEFTIEESEETKEMLNMFSDMKDITSDKTLSVNEPIQSTFVNPVKAREEFYQEEVDRFKALINEQDVNNICSVCGNEGVITLPKKNGIGITTHSCPKCHGQGANRTEMKQEVVLREDVLLKKIPNARYRGFEFSQEELNRQINLPEDMKNKVAFREYSKWLTEKLEDFQNGHLPKSSYLITAPDGWGKKYFVYTAMKHCLSFSLNPSPLLGMSDLVDQILDFDSKFSLNNLREYDILFLSFDRLHLPSEIIAQMMNFCDREGIPVIAISRYTAPMLMENSRRKVNINWLDVFTQTEESYDYGHLFNIGIIGLASREFVNYQSNRLLDFMRNTPEGMKYNKSNIVTPYDNVYVEHDVKEVLNKNVDRNY